MKHGEEIDCPHCGNQTFAVKKAVMEGWNKVGDIFVCSGCGEKIGDAEDPGSASFDKKSEASSALAGFLGVDKEKKKELSATEDEKHFCRDCAHLIPHPFLVRCDLHKKDVNPMDDCPDFKTKQQ